MRNIIKCPVCGNGMWEDGVCDLCSGKVILTPQYHYEKKVVVTPEGFIQPVVKRTLVGGSNTAFRQNCTCSIASKRRFKVDPICGGTHKYV